MGFDSKKYYHNKGQEDAKKGKYECPHGVMDDLTTWSESGMNKNIDDNAAYRKGYANTKGQEDGAKNKYNNPFKQTSEEGKAYDNAWRESYDNEKSKSSGCFITTATVETMGLPDNCYELENMRNFRDNYLLLREDGKKIVAEYYRIAPQILLAINNSNNPKKVYHQLYDNLVLPVVEYIKNKNYEDAIKHYKTIIRSLEKTYLQRK